MKLVLLPNSIAQQTGAVCLDGSAPGFYIQQNPASTKWIVSGLQLFQQWIVTLGLCPTLFFASFVLITALQVFIQGGGWCYDEQDCLGRSKTELGSSKAYTPTIQDDEARGPFDNNSTYNPYFYNYNKVQIQYCDGVNACFCYHQLFSLILHRGQGFLLW
jgi:hypothetical protein